MTFNINVIEPNTPETNGELWINYSVSDATEGTPLFYIDRYMIEDGLPVPGTEVRLAKIEATEETELSDIYIDRTWASNQEYIYQIVSEENEEEIIQYTTSPVYSTLHGVVITAPNGDSYFSELDWEVSSAHNITRSVITTLSSRYPFIINNTLNDFDSGNVSALFLEFDPEVCDYITDNTWRYRKQVEGFLKRFQPVLIRVEDGRAWIASVVNNTISYSKNSALDNITTQFDWDEIGDINDSDDLKEFGFAI